MFLGNMVRDLSNLGRADIPVPTGLKGTQGYLRDYNEAYKRLAAGIKRAIDIITFEYDKDFSRKQEDIGKVVLRLVPTDLKDAKPIVLNPGQMYAPPKRYPLTETQVNRLILESILVDLAPYQTPNRRMDTVDDQKPEINFYHIVKVAGNDLVEVISLRFRKNGSVYSVIDDRLLLNLNDDRALKLNGILAPLDTTEAGEFIPFGYNRLVLLDNVLQHLVQEIEQRERRVTQSSERLKTLISPEGLVQPSLFR